MLSEKLMEMLRARLQTSGAPAEVIERWCAERREDVHRLAEHGAHTPRDLGEAVRGLETMRAEAVMNSRRTPRVGPAAGVALASLVVHRMVSR